ncbi:PQQ-binding-like beta-propeller repeat protein [Roseiconus lacunae]|uniref:PQQ-binding-like beta-propeller repeat protein n=1 Tax=Roseiconus lacunae TaxID=2605694 RepID=UPI001E6240F8|nr:PQQ-binding-like beta-propeller repeat protein [Roseiconus lacunae]MCD0458854.1 PQQ-like beta-propeller repeat protein [Roseiconus lacunae]
MTVAVRSVLFFTACLLLLGICQGEEWYRWRGPNLNGRTVQANWSGRFRGDQANIKWRASVGTGFSSFVATDELVFTSGHIDGQTIVNALSRESGDVAWKFAFEAPLDDRDFEGGPTSTPTIDGPFIYVVSRLGELFCLDRLTGQLSWKVNVANQADVRLPGWGCAGAPLVVGNLVIINIGESGVALNKDDGRIVWRSEDRESGYATPVPLKSDEKDAVVIASGKSYKAVTLESGEELWSIRWLTSFNCNAADPIIHDGQMFLSSGYNRGAALYQLGGMDPKVVWKSKEMKNQIHASVLLDKSLFGIDGDMEAGARFRCLDWGTGEVLWSEEELRPGGFTLVDDAILLLTEDGDLVTAPATRQGWTPTSRVHVLDGKCWTAPVFSNGQIFCRTIQGEVVCVEATQ